MSRNAKSGSRSTSSRRIVRKRSNATTPGADPVAAAARMAELIDEMESIIPDLMQPDITRIPRVAQSAKFARPLIPTTITAVNSYQPLQQRNLFDVTKGQGAIDYDVSMYPIGTRLAALTVALFYSINVKLADSGDDALQVYQWAKRHVKHPDGGGIKTYVDDMQRVVERTMNRRSKPQKPSGPPPSNPPVTPPTIPPTQGFLAPSLAAKAKANSGMDDDEIIDMVHELAKPDSKK